MVSKLRSSNRKSKVTSKRRRTRSKSRSKSRRSKSRSKSRRSKVRRSKSRRSRRKASKKKVNNSVAFCFMVTRDLSKEHIWREWFAKLKIDYNIYVHVSDPDKIKSEWLKQYLIPYNIPTSWNDHMDAELTLLKYAYDQTNDAWFINLSETTVPFVTPKRFKEMFKEYKNKTFLAYKKIWWDPEEDDRGNVHAFPRDAWIGNSEWCVICNEDMKTIIKSWKSNDIISRIMEAPHADESIFAVTLYLENGFKNTINATNTVMDWDRDPDASSPYFFTKRYYAKDKKFIEKFVPKNPYVMFIRKVDSSFPDKVIYEWMDKFS